MKKSKKTHDFKSFLITNKFILILFIFFLFFVLWQHSTGFSWDFSVHSLNAEYIFGDGYYFEWLRPPLTTAIIGVFGFLGFLTAEYIYIIIVSVIHLFSSMKFADSFKIDRTSYYFFSMTAFTFTFSFFAGTELLSLSLLQLSLAYLYTKKSGILFGLSVLARYTNLPFLVFLLFQKNYKKILLAIVFFIVVLSPWLFYNQLMKDNAFASFSDSILLNSESRQHLSQGFKVDDLLLAINFTIPFFVMGLWKKSKKLNKNDMMMILFLLITVAMYIGTPFKEPRYLFTLIVPFAYFSSISIQNVKNKTNILVTFAVITIIALMIFLPQTKLENPSVYQNIASKDNCATLSNIWIPLTYYGSPSEPIFHTTLQKYQISVKTNITQAIDDGYRIILAKFVDDPFTQSIERQDVIEETESYIIMGSGCKEPYRYDKLFSDRINELLTDKDNQISCGLLCSIIGTK